MLHLPLRTVEYILSEFEKKLDKYIVETYKVNEYEKVLIIEDSLALYIGIEKSDFPVCVNVEDKYSWTENTEFMDMPEIGKYYCLLTIEELTYNSLGFNHNHSSFIREMESITGINYLNLDITYTKFRGYTRLYWCLERETLVEEINRLVPEAKLRERYEAWIGVHYYFIILELEDINGNTEYAVAYTNQKPHNYIVSKGREWIKRGYTGADAIRENRLRFKKAFDSWKGKSRQYRLENHLKYIYLEKNFKEKDDVWRFADKILELAYQNSYANEERSTYKRPVNKWISEEIVYNIAKKFYKEHNVIYQHRPFFLKSPVGGQMSYDVFIAGLNIAIEYQGRQHFEPVEFFGGEQAFKKTTERDKLKKELSIQNGVRLIYINYWEDITPKLIKDKIQNELLSCTI